MWPPTTMSAPAAPQARTAAAWPCSRLCRSCSRVTAIGWWTSTMRHCPGRPDCALSSRCATRSICAAETWPSAWRQRRVVFTLSTKTASLSNVGVRLSPKARLKPAYGHSSRAARLNSGMSWLPGMASTTGTRSRSTNARAALNCAAVARWVMSPVNSSTSGCCSCTSRTSASTTGGCSVPKWGSEICSSTVMARHARAQDRSAGSATVVRARPEIARAGSAS